MIVPKLIVTIPAKNEERFIVKTLESLAQQVFGYQFLDYNYFQIDILCNHCTDQTYKVCTNFKASHPHLNITVMVADNNEVKNVGDARKLLMDHASSLLRHKTDLILMTDADTVFQTDMIARLSTYHISPIDMICGKIEVNTNDLSTNTRVLLKSKAEYEQLKSNLLQMFIPLPHDPMPKHSNHSGPCIAIKKSAYKAVKGIKSLNYFEDIDLYKRVLEKGLKVRHDNEMKVSTSARLDSKVIMGFGNELKYWTINNLSTTDYYVESLDVLLFKFESYKIIRQEFGRQNAVLVETLTNILEGKKAAVQTLCNKSENWVQMMHGFELLLESNKILSKKYPLQKVTDVICDLNKFFANKGH